MGILYDMIYSLEGNIAVALADRAFYTIYAHSPDGHTVAVLTVFALSENRFSNLRLNQRSIKWLHTHQQHQMELWRSDMSTATAVLMHQSSRLQGPTIVSVHICFTNYYIYVLFIYSTVKVITISGRLLHAILRHHQSSMFSLHKPPSARRARTLPEQVWSSGLLRRRPRRLELSTSSPLWPVAEFWLLQARSEDSYLHGVPVTLAY